MRQKLVWACASDHRGMTRRRRAVLMLAASAGLALGAAACGGGAAGPAPSAPAPQGNVSVGGAGSGGSGSSGAQGSGRFSLAFAKCMRAHGVPDFPDPNGQAGQLGPASGIDPNSPQFQSALNGPCKSLAPLGWINSGTGPVTR